MSSDKSKMSMEDKIQQAKNYSLAAHLIQI